jgi:DNA-binding response OmpR family regulator
MSDHPRDPGPRPHLLVVEDDPVLLEKCRQALEGRGYAVTGAQSAAEGLRLADSRRFDAVLTGCGLRAILEFQRRSSAPIVFMAEHPAQELREDALMLGAASVLGKPLDFQRLEARLRRTLCPRQAPAREPAVSEHETMAVSLTV